MVSRDEGISMCASVQVLFVLTGNKLCFKRKQTAKKNNKLI